MPFAYREQHPLVYDIECEDGQRCIVYNALAIRNPLDHVPDKWYVRPWAVLPPPDEPVLGPYDSAVQAERAARSRHRGARKADEPRAARARTEAARG